MRATFEQLESRQLLSANLLADSGGISATDSVTINGISYFSADDGTHGKELWQSDGTAAGTHMIKDLTPGAAGSTLLGFSDVNGKAAFFMTSDNVGMSLFVTNGTAAGTTQIGHIAHFADPLVHAVVNHKLLFLEWGGSHSPTMNLWSSDGTAAGTKMIKQVYSESNPELAYMDLTFPIVPVGDGSHAVYMTDQIWVTDGTAAGTHSIPFAAGHRIGMASEIAVVNGKVLYTDASDATGQTNALWSSDGTVAGTIKLINLPGLTNLKQFGNHVLMQFENNNSHLQEIYISDGTPAGTHYVTTLDRQGWADAYVFTNVAAIGNRGLFVVSYDDGRSTKDQQLWITDGTDAGTHEVEDLGLAGAYNLTNVEGKVYFVLEHYGQASGETFDVVQSDGTAAGTNSIVQYPGNMGSEAKLLDIDGRLVIQQYDGTTQVFDPATMSGPVGPHQATYTVSDGILRVFGTTGDDYIRVYRAESNIVVQINGVKRSVPANLVSRIWIYGYSGDDTIVLYEKAGRVTKLSRIWGGDGNDSLYGGVGIDTLYGEDGNDRIFSYGGDDVISGGFGDDNLDGGAGNDTVSGNDGSDNLIGGAGSDMMIGGNDQGHDTIDGNSGQDVIFGQAVYDIFFRGPSNDASSILDDVLKM